MPNKPLKIIVNQNLSELVSHNLENRVRKGKKHSWLWNSEFKGIKLAVYGPDVAGRGTGNSGQGRTSIKLR